MISGTQTDSENECYISDQNDKSTEETSDEEGGDHKQRDA